MSEVGGVGGRKRVDSKASAELAELGLRRRSTRSCCEIIEENSEVALGARPRPQCPP